MNAARIDARAVAKTVAVALLVLAVALLLVVIVLHVRETLRWLAASIFVALALAPTVNFAQRQLSVRGHHPPRWLTILAVYVLAFVTFVVLVLLVVPPLVREVEGLATILPTYVSDFEDWAERNGDFQKLNDKYDLTKTLNEQVANLPSRLGDAANEVKVLSVALGRNLLGAIMVAVIVFFMLLDRGKLFEQNARRFPPAVAERVLRAGDRIYDIVRGYVTVNIVLALAAGVFTWLVLELIGVDIAVPLAVIVVFLDLIPLVGLTIAGALVAVVVAISFFPVGLIVWLVLFLAYQQLQDRVVQPVMYGRAVQVHPVVAIIALLMGAQLAGILGALLAIPVAASIGVVLSELFGWGDEDVEEDEEDEDTDEDVEEDEEDEDTDEGVEEDEDRS